MKEKIVNFYLKEDTLISNYNSYFQIGQIYYPLKSNSNEVILKKLIKLYGNTDNGFLISHISHYDKLINLGVSPSKMCLVNVISSDDVVKYLYDKGVRYFTFDNIKSLKSFLSYADYDKIKISIRLNIFEVFGIYCHLGANTHDCKEMFNLLNEKGITNYGVSFYLQKETFPKGDVLSKMLDYINDNFCDYKMTFLNIGGAIRPDDIDIDKLNKVKETVGARYIIVEPGRYLVGNAGYMETVIIKRQLENTFIISNGIYSGLLDCLLYNKKFELFIKIDSKLVKLEYEPFDGSKELIICGSSSDSGDRIGKFYVASDLYDKIDVGTVIIVNNALTYVEEFFMSLGGDLVKKYNII